LVENTHETQCFGSGIVGAVPRELPAGMALGDWKIEARIGEGGMGIVYSAVHEVIGKRAAIKVIRSEVCRNPGACERFLQEARIVNQIGHRNIIDIFHIGQLDDGRPYLVMELLTGATLGDRLDGGRIPALEAIEILLQICAALEAAHAHGVVHRDLKPDNVILARIHDATVVKLVDWGIAKIRDPEPSPGKSRAGTLIGTPRYIAPEQARGRRVDGCTDVYSLGAIAYEMFLESPPFTCDNVADLLAAHLAEEPPPPRDVWPDIPAELDALLLGMLAKEPAQRPSVAAVAAALLATRVELRRRAGHVDGDSDGQAPPAVANLVVPVGEWSDEPPRRAEAQALLDTHLDVAPSRRRGTAVGVSAAVGSLLLVAMFGYLIREQRGLPEAAAARMLATSSESSAAAIRARPPSMLEVRIRPAGARLAVDGVVIETTAGRALRSVPQGGHEIAVTADGFLPYRRQVDVGPGALTLAIDLEPVARADDEPRRSRTGPERAARKRARPRIDPDATIDPF
jgi:serine/threonine protein kinase